MMKILSWVVIALGMAVVATNWSIPIKYYTGRLKGRSASSIPVIGGLMLSVGLYLSGIEYLSKYFWVPLFLDIGCLPMIFMFVWRVFIKK
jgi:hypothetical protein